jgi:hypothetical protein
MRQHNDSRHISSMDNRSHFHRKKIASAFFSSKKSALVAPSMTKKTHLTGILQKSVAVHRAFLPKRHVFRRKFEQRDRQLTVVYANRVQNAIPAILF